MNQWIELAGHACWITGCALALAVLSYAGWQASLRRQALSAVLRLKTYSLWMDLAGILLSGGLLVTTHALLEKGLWALVCIGFLVQAGLTLVGRSEVR